MTTHANAPQETCVLAPSALGVNAWDMRCPYGGTRCSLVWVTPPAPDLKPDLSMLTRMVLAVSLFPPGGPQPRITQVVHEDRRSLPLEQEAA